MAKPKQQTVQDVNKFIDNLVPDVRSKCSLCNTTLVDVVKKAEAQTGAGTSTVTRLLADKINDGAAPLDRITSSQLRDRVRYAEGKVKVGNSPNKAKSSIPVHSPAKQLKTCQDELSKRDAVIKKLKKEVQDIKKEIATLLKTPPWERDKYIDGKLIKYK